MQEICKGLRGESGSGVYVCEYAALAKVLEQKYGDGLQCPSGPYHLLRSPTHVRSNHMPAE